jgi:hypothetical protein
MSFAGEQEHEEKIPYKIAQQKAKHAVHELHTIMKQNVKSKFKEGGIEAAAKFCADESYEKIKELDKKLGKDISIKRVSLFNRNPESYPEKSEKSIVKAFTMIARSDAHLPKQIVQVVDYTTYKVYSPAVMASRNCKLCHGKKNKVDPKVQQLFEEKYPNDNAYGFGSGEVRGAIVVTVKVK